MIVMGMAVKTLLPNIITVATTMPGLYTGDMSPYPERSEICHRTLREKGDMSPYPEYE